MENSNEFSCWTDDFDVTVVHGDMKARELLWIYRLESGEMISGAIDLRWDQIRIVSRIKEVSSKITVMK